jgi:hypothetical protein
LVPVSHLFDCSVRWLGVMARNTQFHVIRDTGIPCFQISLCFCLEDPEETFLFLPIIC